MALNTKATPADIHASANRHRASADMFNSLEQQVSSEVDGLMAVNRGDLMKKLDSLQNDWSTRVKSVVEKLRVMAGQLDKAGTDIQAADSDSGGNLR
jgi:uncharacterized protein YukE